ncbi:epoxide hydrolase 4-like [Anneissia japonica]|uniref:epoxide hydrolase 4-like n=1 Tax=Anneissia japonica TaxID=1529436 RepID=UPI0014259D93|nr:epoxide hydrolase 4-like [Anneissia japonica]
MLSIIRRFGFFSGRIPGYYYSLLLGLVYGYLVLFGLLYSFIRKGPGWFFKRKRRGTWPGCMDNEELGKHGFLRINNLKLHYVAAGDRSKPLMLFLHGFPECWYSWRHQMKAFSVNYRCVALDMRGFGESDRPSGKESYRMEVLVDDVKASISALGYSSCTLVGHDWGSVIAYTCCSWYPDIVDKVIIINGPHPSRYFEVLKTNPTQFLKAWYIFFFQIPLLPEFALSVGDFPVFKNLFKNIDLTDEQVEVYKYSMSRPGAISAQINYYRGLLTSSSSSWLHKDIVVNTPTLLIWGVNEEAMVMDVTKGLKKYLTNVSKQYVDAGHCVQQEKPSDVNRLMKEFLEE